MTTQERFANDYGMTLETVRELVTLAKWAGRGNEGECNGDPHADSPDRTDKAANARCWARDVERITGQIERLVTPYGFTAVVYTGLGPTLKRGEVYVEIPY